MPGASSSTSPTSPPANPRAAYRVVPVMVVGMDGVQVGDEVRVVTSQGKQASTGYVTEIRDGLAKVRYGTGGGAAEVPVERLEVVSRWVKFPRAGEMNHG